MKKIVPVLFLMILLVLPIKVKAISVSENDVNVQKGETKTIDLYANVEQEIKELSFTLTFSSYDARASLVLEQGLTDTTPTGISHNIVFSTPVSGTVKIGSIQLMIANNPSVTNASVSINYPKAITTNGERVNLNYKDININIGENIVQEVVVEKGLLERIESSIVNIQLQEDVYEYTVNVKNDIQQLDLKPIAKDSNAVVDIPTQTISELSNNTIIIKVSNNNVTEEYKIKVNVTDSMEEVIQKPEKEETKENNEPQEKFSYKGKWVGLIIALTGMLFLGLLLNKKSK